MQIYAIAVICAIVISGAIMLLLCYRAKLLEIKTLVSITFASLVTAFSLPVVFNLISSYKGNDLRSSALVFVTLAAFATFVILILILSVLISFIVPKIGSKSNKSSALTVDAGGVENDAAQVNATSGVSPDVASQQDDNYLEQIFTNYISENRNFPEIPTKNEEIMSEDANNLEKSVDSAVNIDKMGIENNMHDVGALTIEECIEEAFRLKEEGDSEGAIIYCMYALDKKPPKELTFWIVLDICVMYKALGQRELALDILNSYYDIYGEIMDVTVKEEIESNLNDTMA
ncbi:MAG: hypothetical protein GXY17_11435 [Clostridiaceae bacterium]|nr:hypothetical protein [Clostridiaceae bacterium]